MHAMNEDGPRRSPRGISASPEPAGTSSSGSGGQRARGRPRKDSSPSSTPSSSPVSGGRTTRSSSFSSVSSSGSKRDRSSRLAAAGGDEATCISRGHPEKLRCDCCSRNRDKFLLRTSAVMEPCQQLWIRANCNQYQIKTHNLIKEWEKERVMQIEVPDLVTTKADKKKGDETASPVKKNHRFRKATLEQEPSSVASAAAAAAASSIAAFEPAPSTGTSMPSRSTPPSIAPPIIPAATPSPLVSPTASRTASPTADSPSLPTADGCPGMYSLTPETSGEQLARYVPYLVRAMRLTANKLADMAKGMANSANQAVQKAAISYVRDYIRRGILLLPINTCDIELSPGTLAYRSISCVRSIFGGIQPRCANCDSNMAATRMASGRAATPIQIPVPPTTPIKYILEDMETGRSALVEARERYRMERRLRLKAEQELRMNIVGRYADGRTADGVILAMEEANKVIGNHYDEGTDERELWEIHFQHVANVTRRDGKTKGIRYEQPILDLAIAILASTSHSVYDRLQKVFKLPDRSYVCRLSAKKVTTKGTKLRNIHTNTLSTMNEFFKGKKMNRKHPARIGKISMDAVNINSTLEHDKKSNLICGMDQTLSLTTVKQQFSSLVRGSKSNEAESSEADAEATTGTGDSEASSGETNDDFGYGEASSIIDNLLLADQNLCLRWTSLDPDVKMSEIIATIDVSKTTPEVVAALAIEAMDIAASTYGIYTSSMFADDAGENAKFADTFSVLAAKDLMDEAQVKDYEAKGVDLSVRVGFNDLTTGNLVALIPDMPHLSKNVVTAMEFSSKKNQKRNLRRGKKPVNLNMIKVPWVKTGGKSKQQHPTKLTVHHFEKNSHLRMKIRLAMQVLSNSVKTMLEKACLDNTLDLVSIRAATPI